MKLRNKTAIVTGASEGIGKATSLLFAKQGADLVLIARGRAKLEAVAKQIESLDRRVLVGAIDVRNEPEVQHVVREAIDKFEGIDFLINNAGAFWLAPIVETGVEDWDAILDTNLKGVFLCTKTVLKRMIKQKEGHIINVSSVAGKTVFPNNAAYGSSKFGLEGFHRVLTNEARPHNVKTSIIYPAAVDTPLWDKIPKGAIPDLPAKDKILKAEDIAALILHIATQPNHVLIDDVSVTSWN